MRKIIIIALGLISLGALASVQPAAAGQIATHGGMTANTGVMGGGAASAFTSNSGKTCSVGTPEYADCVFKNSPKPPRWRPTGPTQGWSTQEQKNNHPN